MSNLTKNIKVTIGGPETTVGSSVAREYVIPHTGVPGIDRSVETTEDPAVIGKRMSSGQIPVAAAVGGSLDISPRPVGGFGMLVKGALGSSYTPVEIGGILRIKYSGDDASAKIVVSDTGQTITVTTGALESESADGDFGTAGVIDVSATDFDTLGELQTEIDSYTNYSAEIVMGATSVDTTSPVAITAAQGKSRWVYILFEESGSGIYAHRIPVKLDNTALPAYSVQVDGMQDNRLDAGVVVDTLSLSGSIKALLEGSVSMLGLTETGEQAASSLSLEDADPLVLYRAGIAFGGNDYSDVRNLSVELQNNSDADGYGQGSIDRSYHAKGNFAASYELDVRLNDTSYAERANKFTADVAGLSWYAVDADSAANVTGGMIYEAPYCTVDDFQMQDNNGVLRATISGGATAPKGTYYGDPVAITLITSDSAEY